MSETRHELIVPQDHPCFADHFPSRAIVPGALILQWLCQRIQGHYPGQRVSRVKSLKFLGTLEPGDCCCLSLAVGVNSGQLKFRLLRGEETVCHGVVDLVAEQGLML